MKTPRANGPPVWEKDSTAIDRRPFRLIAVDIDGTLAGSDGRVTGRTVASLGRAERSGLIVVLVTGRAYPSALAIWRSAGLSGPLITCGGALTTQPPQLTVLDVHALPERIAVEAIRLGLELDLSVSLWTREAIWMTREDRFAVLLRDLHRSGSDEMDVRILAADPRAPVPYGTAPVVKAMLGAEPDHLDEVTARDLARLSPATAARSMPEFIDVTPAGASKHEALTAVLHRLAISPDQVIAVGDGDNDVGMLSLAGLAVVPSNAMSVPRSVADVVIGHHDREGVAEFLDSFLGDVPPEAARPRRPA